MGKKIKLLVFTKTLDGGTGTFVLDFLDIQQLFKRSRLKIKTLVLEKPSFRKIKSRKLFYWANSNYYPEKYTLSLDNIIKFLKEIFWFEKQVSAFKLDLVLTIDSHCMLVTDITKLLYRKRFKTIITMHNNLMEVIFVKSTPYLHRVLTRIITFFLNRANKVVCVSRGLSKNFYSFFKLKKLPQTIYCGLSLKTGRVRKAPQGRVVILSIARLAEQKDHETLLKAFHLLQKERLNPELWLAGEGPLRKKLVGLGKKLSISKRVKFLGWVQNPTSLIKKCHIFVLSSKREGFGYVLIEAMSQGVPVISSDVPFGPSEILGGGKYGILVPPGKPESIKEAILKILDKNDYEYYSRMALQRSKQFSKEKMLKKYKKIIFDLLYGNSPTGSKGIAIE